MDLIVRYGFAVFGITFIMLQQAPGQAYESATGTKETKSQVTRQNDTERRRFVSCTLGVPRAGAAVRKLPGRTRSFRYARTPVVESSEGLVYDGQEGYIPYGNLGIGHSPQLFIKLGPNGGIVDSSGRPYKTPQVLGRP